MLRHGRAPATGRGPFAVPDAWSGGVLVRAPADILLMSALSSAGAGTRPSWPAQGARDMAPPATAPPVGAGRDGRRWQRMFDDAPLGVLVLTFDGQILEANRALFAMLVRRPDEVLGRHFHDFAAPGESTRLDRDLLLRTGHAGMEKSYLRGDGSLLWLRVSTSLVIEDGEHRILAICEDVTPARRAQAELVHRADHDVLTGLPNRELLRRRLAQDLGEVRSGQRAGVALLFLDLDRFKVINDSLGHGAGDRLLREVAARLRAAVPPADLLARLGGDEFALVAADAPAAPLLAQRLVDVLDAPFVLDSREVTVGASVGVALRGGPLAGAEDGEAVLREADTAMYAAKRAGAGRVVVFEESLRRRAVARLEDEQGLRRGLQRGELRVHYQPILRLADLRTEGFEALVRWQHPERGLLAPGSFLPIAEEAGLLVELERQVLHSACAELARWRAGPGREHRGTTVSVNVSAQHLAAGSLIRDVEHALHAAALEPDALTLEITEQALVVSHEKAAVVLAELRDRGCRIALDDFGTGYSSLAYLRRLPVDTLKIDRTFVAGAGTPPHCRELLSAIAALGASLGLSTVVEGVEDSAELGAARSAGATHVQGYLLGRPQPAAQAVAGPAHLLDTEA